LCIVHPGEFGVRGGSDTGQGQGKNQIVDVHGMTPGLWPTRGSGSLFEAAMLHVVFIGFRMTCLSTQATNDRTSSQKTSSQKKAPDGAFLSKSNRPSAVRVIQ
jgi:hypothetical protein